MIFLSCFLERKIFFAFMPYLRDEAACQLEFLLEDIDPFWEPHLSHKELLLTKFVPSSVMNVVISCI